MQRKPELCWWLRTQVHAVQELKARTRLMIWAVALVFTSTHQRRNGLNTTVWRITLSMNCRKLSAQIFRLWKGMKAFSGTQWVVTEL